MTAIGWLVYALFILLIVPASAFIMSKFERNAGKIAIGVFEAIVCAFVAFAIQFIGI